jgi:hypothetical protein
LDLGDDDVFDLFLQKQKSAQSYIFPRSSFIRAQWESGKLEDVDDERRQILEEAVELDHI